MAGRLKNMGKCERRTGSRRAVARIPFEIDRAQRGTLVAQLADGLRRAIRGGVYRKGDRLPSARELVAYFGVSSRVPVAALKILAAEGLVEAAPRRGYVVRILRSPVWKGHVLCIVPSGDFSYSVSMLAGCVRSALCNAGYMFTQVTVPRKENGLLDTRLLEYMLQQPVDFAVLLADSRRLATTLEKARVPFISQPYEDCDVHEMCRCVYQNGFSKAYGRFVACCRDSKCSRVMYVVKRPGEGSTLVDMLSKAGVAAEEWCLNPKRQGHGRLEILRRTAFNAFDARLAEGRDWLPDVVCFNDDYTATGAMAALCAHGVRFPEDVRLVTVVNKGNAPVFKGSFDCFEIDPEVCGGMIADTVLKCISGAHIPHQLELPVRFATTD